MFEATAQFDFTPGTNLRGHVSGACWTLLLPRLDLERIVCLGPVGAPSLSRLAQLGQEVLVACRTRRQFASMRSLATASGLSRVSTVLVADYAHVEAPPAGLDLIVLADSRAVRLAAAGDGFLETLRSWLKPDGVLYCESRGWRGRSHLRRLGQRLGGLPVAPVWLAPLRGEVQTAVPRDDRSTIAYLLARGLAGRPVPAITRAQGRGTLARMLSEICCAVRRRSEARANRSDGARNRLGRHAVLAGSPVNLLDGPPDYLRDLAHSDGVDVDGCRWLLAALGQFGSRKVLWYLFDQAADPPAGPSHIVKMTRTPAYNARLERERDALRQLASWGMGADGTLPRVAFAGEHGGLAILGETAVEGAPFDDRSSLSPACPHVRSALEWFTRLGASTADPLAAEPDQVAARLGQLREQLAAIYPLTPAQQRFLESRIAVVAHSRDPLPLVFQHGDAGRWNLLVTSTNRVAVLDWESAETGLPLWDVFYLFRSIVSGAARRRGRAGRRARLERMFLHDAACGALLAETVADYSRRVGLAPELVEPLFYTCWMHRALKEATRLAPDKLAGGPSFQWLTRCIEHRTAPTLQRLFALSPEVRFQGAVEGAVR